MMQQLAKISAEKSRNGLRPRWWLIWRRTRYYIKYLRSMFIKTTSLFMLVEQFYYHSLSFWPLVLWWLNEPKNYQLFREGDTPADDCYSSWVLTSMVGDSLCHLDRPSCIVMRRLCVGLRAVWQGKALTPWLWIPAKYHFRAITRRWWIASGADYNRSTIRSMALFSSIFLPADFWHI